MLASSQLDSSAIDQLRRQVRGEVIASVDPTYDTERRVWNAMVDRFPALIVQCQNPRDIAAVKARYDLDNLFRHNQNILPGSPTSVQIE